jgi:peptidoglycan/xylan/chitin deacetylase (PgdA/CDA1 family)
MGATRVINLCFHGIGVPGRTQEPGEADYWIDRDTYLRVLDEIATWPNVAISFDDGNASDHDIGLPGLVERGLTASFFVLAGRIDTPGSLSADQLRALVAVGMTVGSHGMHHVPWPGLDDRARHTELVEARTVLAEIVATDVDEAACPLGRYDRTVLRELRRLGYTRVHTSDRMAAPTAAWIQPRYSVRRTDTPATLRASILERQAAVDRLRPAVVGALKRWR